MTINVSETPTMTHNRKSQLLLGTWWYR